MVDTTANLAEQYRLSFLHYLSGQKEEALAQAYEVGRQAASNGIGLLGLATLYQETLLKVLSGKPTLEEVAHTVEVAFAFLEESLAPFEMTRRGFRDTIQQLRQRNEEMTAAYQQLRREEERAESLLLNVLPQPVAERLKAGETLIADSFPEATLLFADIVDSVKLSLLLRPEELVRLLNQVFSLFDGLAQEYGLEKIKTIGDEYMVAGGIPVPRPDHAEAVADMALGMLSELPTIPGPGGKPLQVRIGISTGPVVAGVVGTKKFIYDVWGETVNLASRMQSTGLPQRIQVTSATHRRLRGRYLFRERLGVVVPTVGEMTTYLLIRRKG